MVFLYASIFRSLDSQYPASTPERRQVPRVGVLIKRSERGILLAFAGAIFLTPPVEHYVGLPRAGFHHGALGEVGVGVE